MGAERKILKIDRFREEDSVVRCTAEKFISPKEKAAREAAFGAELYRLRTLAGMLQGTVARTAGLSRAYYGQVENSKKSPPPHRTVMRIAAAMELSARQCDELLRIANIERCRVVHIPAGLPAESEHILRTLATAIYSLSEDQVRQISQIMRGETHT